MRFAEAKRAWCVEYWKKLLAEHGSVRKAALAAGVNRTYAHKLLRSLGFELAGQHRGNWGDLSDE
jgi:hypothetical protein